MMNLARHSVSCLTLLLLCFTADASRAADKSLQGIACRSVHFVWADAPEGVAFYNEVKVTQSAPGTYFCVCGFSRGYYGIQQLADDRRLLIFSVWDPGKQNDPNSVARSDRVQLIHRHEDVRVARFGNEGTGGQSFLDYEWADNTALQFIVGCRRAGDRTHYAAFFYHVQDEEWMHLVTFSTLTPDQRLKGYYSFVEDFRRNRISATQTRTAQFGNGFVLKSDGTWHALSRARFTADSNPVTNINAGIVQQRFFLSTGGRVSNDNASLGSTLDFKSAELQAPALNDSVVAKWLSSQAGVNIR